MHKNELMTTDQVSKLLGVDVRTVHRLAGKRLPVAYKIRGRTGALLFHRADVEAELRRRTAA